MTPRAANVSTNASDSEWNTIVEPFAESWDFTKNPVLIGTYVSTKEIEVDDPKTETGKRTVQVYNVQNDEDGKQYAVWGSYNIDQGFAQIGEGQVIRIEHLGKVPTSTPGQTVNRFLIQTK